MTFTVSHLAVRAGAEDRIRDTLRTMAELSRPNRAVSTIRMVREASRAGAMTESEAMTVLRDRIYSGARAVGAELDASPPRRSSERDRVVS